MAAVALRPKLVLSICRSMKLVKDLMLVALPMLCLLYMAKNMKLLFIDMSMLLFLNSKMQH